MKTGVFLILIFKVCCVFADTSPLIEAIQEKKVVADIRELLDKGADVNAIDMEFLRRRKSVLCYAIDRGKDPESLKIINLLISRGADVNGVIYNRVEGSFYGFMPLLTYAVIYSSPEVVRLMLDAGAEGKKPVEASDMDFKKSALEVARMLARPEIVKMLKDKEALERKSE